VQERHRAWAPRTHASAALYWAVAEVHGAARAGGDSRGL